MSFSSPDSYNLKGMGSDWGGRGNIEAIWKEWVSGRASKSQPGACNPLQGIVWNTCWWKIRHWEMLCNEKAYWLLKRLFTPLLIKSFLFLWENWDDQRISFPSLPSPPAPVWCICVHFLLPWFSLLPTCLLFCPLKFSIVLNGLIDFLYFCWYFLHGVSLVGASSGIISCISLLLC